MGKKLLAMGVFVVVCLQPVHASATGHYFICIAGHCIPPDIQPHERGNRSSNAR